MAKTRTPGITVLADGRLFIDKRYLGVCIGLRVGALTQEQAEERLRVEMAQIEYERERKAHARPTFADCAGRYVAQSRSKRSIDVIRWHVQLLARYIGNLEPRQVHDATLEPFIKDRVSQGASATTINRTLEVVRTILNRDARSYRDPDGSPWLEAMPPLISMLPEDPRLPYPLSWEEQDRLFRRLPTHLARMALFAINTGLRQSNLCGLQWPGEVPVPEIARSVFVIPAEAFKTKRPHVVILNDVAWSIIKAQRGLHPIWVFPFRGTRISRLNTADGGKHGGKQTCHEFASMTCGIRSGCAYAQRAFRRKIAKHCSAMPIIQWPAIMQVPMGVACWRRRTRLSTQRNANAATDCGRAIRTRGREVPNSSAADEGALGFARQVLQSPRDSEDQWIRAPTRVPQQQEHLVFAPNPMKSGAPGRI